jgi:hypothetical protein
MQIAIALGGMLLLVAGAMALLVGIAWFALVVTRRLPLIGRRQVRSAATERGMATPQAPS